MRIELVAWVLVHGLGMAVNLAGIITCINLASRPGNQAKSVLRGIIAVCALTIHSVSVFTGTSVVAELPTAQVWAYAILQGVLFLTIGLINALIGRLR